MKVCSPLQISSPFSMARESRRIQALGELAARGSDADEQRVRFEREPFIERRDDWDVAAESEHLLRGLSGLARVDDADDALRRVPDAGVRGLGFFGAEETVGQNEVTQVADTRCAVRWKWA